MATVLTLTPKPEYGAVLIEVTDAPAGPLEITRTDNNGSALVRLQENQEPISGALSIFDHEAALTGNIEYSLIGDTGTVTGVTTLDVTKPILNVPVLANQRQELVGVREYGSDEEASTTIHYVQDRSDPIVVSGPQRTRQGSLTVYAPDYATTRSIAKLAKSGEVLLFRQPTHPGMDMYLVPRTVSTRKGERLSSGWAFDVDIAYTEVKSPSAPQQASTWNYGEVKAVGTYAQVKAAFPTYRDLVAGP